ncbi:aromatic amino acid lyase [bacterium]|nr:aromatic amino acid lyase [bacterium]
MRLAPIVVGDRLTVTHVDAVARRRAPAIVAPGAGERLARSHAFLQELAAGDAPVYGLTTGCGPLAGQRIDAAARAAFQRNLVRSHAVALGPPHGEAAVRAAMLVRAQVFAQGCSGVAPATVDLLLGMLNAGVHPLVREVGGVGASGDLVELAEIALVAIGEGEAAFDGRIRPAGEALRAAGLAPLTPSLREGLALINGTSFHAGAAALVVAGARRLVAAAQVAAALSFEALGGHPEALDPALHAARPHPGQAAVAARLRELTRGSALLRRDAVAGSQDAYTVRCIPQIVGPVLEALDGAAAVVEVELNAVSDNPLFLAAERRVVHGGNFHGQPVAMALDRLKAALIALGVAGERRIARVLDARLSNGLPPFLIRGDAGLQSGFMGLQYAATTIAAEQALLAAPASVRSLPTNANNQDMVPMGMLAARHALRVLDGARQLVAIEMLCAAQALDLRGAERAGAGTRAAHAAIRAVAAPLLEDRGLRPDVEALVALIEDDGVAP